MTFVGAASSTGLACLPAGVSSVFSRAIVDLPIFSTRLSGAHVRFRCRGTQRPLRFPLALHPYPVGAWAREWVMPNPLGRLQIFRILCGQVKSATREIE